MKLTGKRRRERIGNAATYTVLIVLSIVWLLPFLYLILQAFRGESTGMVNYILPKTVTVENFVSLFRDTDFPKWFSNTLIVSIVVSVIQTAIVLMVSYALSRMRFRGRRALMNLILVLGMFPAFMSMIAVYYILKGLNLTEGVMKLVALVLVYSARSAEVYPHSPAVL